jgi:hypothetical protein
LFFIFLALLIDLKIFVVFNLTFFFIYDLFDLNIQILSLFYKRIGSFFLFFMFLHNSFIFLSLLFLFLNSLFIYFFNLLELLLFLLLFLLLYSFLFLLNCLQWLFYLILCSFYFRWFILNSYFVYFLNVLGSILNFFCILFWFCFGLCLLF